MTKLAKPAKKVRPEWLERDLLTPPVYLTLCTTPQMYYEEMKRLNVLNPVRFMKSDNANATTQTFENDTGKHIALVCLGPVEKHEPVEIACLLVHEAVHVFDYMMECIGEVEPSSELKAYGIQTIAQRLMFEYVRQKEALKK